MTDALRRIRLWDLPVRLVHWSFAALLPALWWTAESGKIDLHKTLGLTMLGLVFFRILWGFYGSSTARFANFVKGPETVLGYVRSLRENKKLTVIGHNPLGGWSVVLLLGLLGFQATIGLFTIDEDGLESGPLNYLVSFDTSDLLREAHGLVFNVILATLTVHLAAIAYYSVIKKDRLVPPMISGSRDIPASLPAPRIAPLWQAIPAILLAAAFAYWLGMGAPTSLTQNTAASSEAYN
ncbi:MAG: hypothetical protein RLZZ136_1036 [Pseudomonadota bacterium]|jgi:cytochrome b